MPQAALIRLSDLDIYKEFYIPEEGGIRVEVPGGHTISPAYIGWTSPNGAWRIVELVRDDTRPGEYYHRGEYTKSLTGNTLTFTRQWTPWTQTEIDAYLETQDESRIDEALYGKMGKILLKLVNEIRGLKGQAAIDGAQLRSWVKAL